MKMFTGSYTEVKSQNWRHDHVDQSYKSVKIHPLEQILMHNIFVIVNKISQCPMVPNVLSSIRMNLL